MTTQQQPRDELVVALGQIAELHRSRPVYPAGRSIADPSSPNDRPIGHHCPTCGDPDDDTATPLEEFACRTAELAALALMRETLTGSGTEQVIGRG